MLRFMYAVPPHIQDCINIWFYFPTQNFSWNMVLFPSRKNELDNYANLRVSLECAF